MKIALDYDLTYTADPYFWSRFLGMCSAHGHKVKVVTVRDDRFDRTAPLVDLEQLVPVVYTRGTAKRWFMEHFGDGFVPDIWIDDKPESILNNSTISPDALAKWRAEREDGPQV